ncbi:hypothetical protein KA005_67610, partial [bacterium]|nr:hypothetical protein [bacterium]
MSILYIMEEDLFSRLERRPVPKAKKQFTINVPQAQVQQPVEINVEIQDLTSQKLFNRADFEARLRAEEGTAQVKPAMAEPPVEEPPADPFRATTVPGDPVSLKPKRKKPPPLGSVKIEGPVATDVGATAAATSSRPASIKVKGKMDTRLILKPGVKSILSKGTVTDKPRFQEIQQKKRRTQAPDFDTLPISESSQVTIGKNISKRLPPPSKGVSVITPRFYLNNREKFVDFIDRLFSRYTDLLAAEEKDITCADRGGNDFSLLAHQQIIRDYINLYTPYRGLLLYHGLGAGKTCGSIGIAEGFRESKQIIIMTPASLRMNYIEEIKKCGDLLYKKNQFWEFIQVGDNIELINALSKALNLSPRY